MAIISNNVRLMDTQKSVLVTLASSETTAVYLGHIAAKDHVATAQKQLQKLGLIQVHGESITVTDKGKAVMKDENLIDDTEELTSYGSKFLYKNEAMTMTLKDFLIETSF